VNGVGPLGQRPDELGEFFDKLIHVATPKLELREVGRVNSTQPSGLWISVGLAATPAAEPKQRAGANTSRRRGPI
jgi:hypothetical protein